MKVRISIPGMYMAMEMEEEQARVTFRKMAELLWVFRNKSQKQSENTTAGNEREPGKPVPIIPPTPEPESKIEVMEVPEEDGEEQGAEDHFAGVWWISVHEMPCLWKYQRILR